MQASRLIPLFSVVIGLLCLAGVSWVVRSHNASERYKLCSELAVSNPEKALEMAKTWRAANATSPIALHCEALAFYGTKNYSQAATDLEKLAKDTPKKESHLAVNLLLQAAESHREAKEPLLAVQDLDQVLVLEPDNVEAKAGLAEISGKKQ